MSEPVGSSAVEVFDGLPDGAVVAEGGFAADTELPGPVVVGWSGSRVRYHPATPTAASKTIEVAMATHLPFVFGLFLFGRALDRFRLRQALRVPHRPSRPRPQIRPEVLEVLSPVAGPLRRHRISTAPLPRGGRRATCRSAPSKVDECQS